MSALKKKLAGQQQPQQRRGKTCLLKGRLLFLSYRRVELDCSIQVLQQLLAVQGVPLVLAALVNLLLYNFASDNAVLFFILLFSLLVMLALLLLSFALVLVLFVLLLVRLVLLRFLP